MIQTDLYKDDFMQASEYLRMVLPFLSKHKIPASPVHYQTGYEYMSGSNAALKKALDEINQQSAELTENTMLELHKQYIALDGVETLNSVRQELLKIIGKIQNEYDISGGGLSEYLNSLNSFFDILSGSAAKSTLAVETQKVAEDTRSTEIMQRKFESQMTHMMDEMETLRNQLDQVKEESLTDALTGLFNRKAFDQKIDKQIQIYAEEKVAFSLVIADIDYFKKFNDNYGHLVGDKVLKYVAKTIKSCVKGKDLAVRFGGEEFVLILPETEIAGAEIVAEHVRTAISKSSLIDHKKNINYGHITLSLGVSQYQQGELPEELLKRADEALYRAKENGRNKVEKAD